MSDVPELIMKVPCTVIGFLVLSSSLCTPNLGVGMQGAGTLAGRVSFQGVIPQGEVLEVNQDQDVCGKSVVRKKVTVNPENRGLQFAIVSLESLGSPLERAPTQGTLVLNEGCAFSPRIAAAQSLDSIEIRNQDPILHNTHITINQRTFLNVAQLPGGARPITKTIKQSGLHQVLCDKHKFMSGVLMVFDHPYFRVTNDRGEFRITGIPPGQYITRVWHEILGIQDQQITISSEGMSTVTFDY